MRDFRIEMLQQLTPTERAELMADVAASDWTACHPIRPKELMDGTRTGWFCGDLLMKRKVKGAWYYRRPTLAEKERENRQRADEQVW